jgi:hypothetical protein
MVLSIIVYAIGKWRKKMLASQANYSRD